MVRQLESKFRSDVRTGHELTAKSEPFIYAPLAATIVNEFSDKQLSEAIGIIKKRHIRGVPGLCSVDDVVDILMNQKNKRFNP